MHEECAADYAIAEREKKERKAEKAARMAAKVDKALTKQKLKALAPLRELIHDAQVAFNAWVRARDEGLPCISCLELNPSTLGVGGAWDAGHFQSRGAYPEKRFMEDNVHKQCKVCNGGSAKNPAKALTVQQAYELNLIARIGQDRVDAVKAPIPVHKWSREELTEIRDHYRAKLRELKKGNA